MANDPTPPPGFTKSDDGMLVGNASGSHGGQNDYTQWTWYEIEAAIFGAVDWQNDNDWAEAYAVSNPQSLADAAGGMYYAQTVLQMVADNLTRYGDALAGKDDSPWRGDAATTFHNAVTNFANQIKANVDVLLGGPNQVDCVWSQLLNLANALAWAQWQAKAIDQWYAQQARILDYRYGFKDPTTTGYGSINDYESSMLTNEMRGIMKQLIQVEPGGYAIKVDPIVPPQPVTNDPPPPNTKDAPPPPDLKSPPPPPDLKTPPPPPDLKTPPPPELTAPPPPPDASSLPPPPDLSTLPPPDLSALPPPDLSALPPPPNLSGGPGLDPNDLTIPGLDGPPTGDTGLPGLGDLFPSLGGPALTLPGRSGLTSAPPAPPLPDLANLAGTGAAKLPGVGGSGLSRLGASTPAALAAEQADEELAGLPGLAALESSGPGLGINPAASESLVGGEGMPMMPPPMGMGGAGNNAGGEPSDASGLLVKDSEPFATEPVEELVELSAGGTPRGGPGLSGVPAGHEPASARRGSPAGKAGADDPDTGTGAEAPADGGPAAPGSPAGAAAEAGTASQAGTTAQAAEPVPAERPAAGGTGAGAFLAPASDPATAGTTATGTTTGSTATGTAQLAPAGGTPATAAEVPATDRVPVLAPSDSLEDAAAWGTASAALLFAAAANDHGRAGEHTGPVGRAVSVEADAWSVPAAASPPDADPGLAVWHPAADGQHPNHGAGRSARADLGLHLPAGPTANNEKPDPDQPEAHEGRSEQDGDSPPPGGGRAIADLLVQDRGLWGDWADDSRALG